MSGKISVIIPVYQAKEYLNRCLDSVLGQTYENLQIILVDDGSTDGSAEVCDEYAKKDERVIVIHKTNGGVSNARNAGLDCVEGDYIGFIDSDDYIELDMYENLVKLMVENCADIACGSMVHYDEFGAWFMPEHPDVLCCTGVEAIKSMFANDCEPSGYLVNKLYKKELFVGKKFDATIKVREDSFLMWELFFSSSRVVCKDLRKYHYLFNTNSAINGKYNDRFYTAHMADMRLLNKTKLLLPEAVPYATMHLIGADKMIIEKMFIGKAFDKNVYREISDGIKANYTAEVRKNMSWISRVETRCLLSCLPLFRALCGFKRLVKKVHRKRR